MADGNRVVFAPNYSNAVDANDAIKLTNPGENFGVLRDNKLLAVEARQPISTDTLFYRMTNLVSQTYKLVLVPQNLIGTNSICELIDNYKNTRTFISLMDTTTLDFIVTNDAGSKAVNRLMLVFGPAAGPLPVKFTSISATQKQGSVVIQWKVEDELNVRQYEVERSENGSVFRRINNAVSSSALDGKATYSNTDMSPLATMGYYRIKAISNDGKVQYSAIVRTFASDISEIKATIRLYPNPTADRVVQVQFMNYITGNYSIRITDMLGQMVYSASQQVTSTNFIKSIILPSTVSSGNYNVSVIGSDGQITTRQVVVN